MIQQGYNKKVVAFRACLFRKHQSGLECRLKRVILIQSRIFLFSLNLCFVNGRRAFLHQRLLVSNIPEPAFCPVSDPSSPSFVYPSGDTLPLADLLLQTRAEPPSWFPADLWKTGDHPADLPKLTGQISPSPVGRAKDQEVSGVPDLGIHGVILGGRRRSLDKQNLSLKSKESVNEGTS